MKEPDPSASGTPDTLVPSASVSPGTDAHQPESACDTRELLLAYLRDRDAFCPLCRYNVRGLTEPRCPECGKGLVLTVGLAEPFLKAWLLLVVPLCAGAGFGVLFLMGLLAQGWPDPHSHDWRDTAFSAIIVGFMLTVPGAMVALLRRRKFLRMEKGHQYRIAGTVAVVVILMFIVLLAIILSVR